MVLGVLSANSGDGMGRRYPKPSTVAWVCLLSMAVVVMAANGAVLSPASNRQSYADVPTNSVFWPAVEHLAKMGVTTGYPCGGHGEPCDELTRPYFRVAGPLTHKELSMMVSKVKGVSEMPVVQRPDAAVTRKELAEVISLADPALFQDIRIPGRSSFQDVPQDAPYRQYIEQVYALGIMKGYDCGSVSPREPCVPPDNNPYFHPDSVTTLGQSANVLAAWIKAAKR